MSSSSPSAKAAVAKVGSARRSERAQSPATPRLTHEHLLQVYRAMLRIRILDERMMTLQRQGRVGFYGACTGQEAACLGSAFALEKTDWIFPALREGSAMLLRGFPLVPYIAQVFGNSGDITKGRQMPSHQAAKSVNQVSWSSCIGTQLPHAVGVAWAAKLKKADTVVLAFLGDGATSSADFHVAMNFAGVFKVPIVFVCQNNHWSISLPTWRQTASESIAIKADAYGMPGVRVDGNDVEAVYAAARQAIDQARKGDGPTLIEAETYRIGAHSSSDDPTRYRDQHEVDEWKARDPVDRLRARLEQEKIWDAAADERLRGEILDEVNAAIAEAEKLPPPAPESLFDDVYADEPWNVVEQRRQFLAAVRRS